MIRRIVFAVLGALGLPFVGLLVLGEIGPSLQYETVIPVLLALALLGALLGNRLARRR